MHPGEMLGGRYRIAARAGAGGMGAVFRADDVDRGATVAIKIFDRQLDGERARREAQALRSLDHPAIVRYVADGETADGRLFLVMEWLDGSTVADRIAEQGFTLAGAVAVARHVGGALAAAHAAGIVHRDVKPSNVMLVGDRIDGAKLVDFGIARIVATPSLTRSGTTMGTPGYMAPEQARGKRDLTAAVDVFALGCVLYECATAHPAFSGSATAAVMTKILMADPVPLATFCPEAPPALCELVERMLARRPADRPRSAADVVAALDALGAMPATEPRSSAALVSAPTVRVAPTSHCVVISSRGQPDDVLPPPTPAQCDELDAAAARWHGHCEVLATGVAVAYFHGARGEVETNAAGYAADARRVVADFVTVISAIDEDLGRAIDRGTLKASHDALAAIVSRSRHR